MVKEPIGSRRRDRARRASSSRVRAADDGAMRGSHRPAPAVLLGLIVTGALAAAPAAGVPADATTSASTIAPGITYTKTRDARGPWIVHVAEVDLSSAPTLDIATAGPRIGLHATTSVIGSTRGAVVAINGDFGVDPGRPLHALTRDGVLMAAGLQNGANFAISQDELSRYVSNDRLSVNARNLTTHLVFPVPGWNSGAPLSDAVAAFTPYGGRAERPPVGGCFARLKPARAIRWGVGGVGVARDYRVEASRCASTSMWVRHGTIVLASKRWGAGAEALRETVPGQRLRLTWGFGWTGVVDSVGGMPLIVKDGRNLGARCASSFCGRNPRTALAVTADGTLLMVVVDGRSGSSVGMSLPELGRYLVDLGAVDAINLDGGGSSTMWIRHRGVVNDPSDSTGERSITSAVLVLPGADVDEPIPMTAGSSAPASGVSALADGSSLLVPHSSGDALRASWLAAMDPGSTGGLLDAMLAGDIGSGEALQPRLVRTALAFRASV